MRFFEPVVPKSLHDAEITRLVEALKRTEDRYAALVDQVVNLRRDGFVAPAQPHVPSEPRKVGPEMSTAVQRAVEQVVADAPDKLATYAALVRFVALEQVRGTPEATLVQRIIDGDADGRFGTEDDE